MAKPFSLTFEYTPKWKGNRNREELDRITVRLRDYTESKRIEILDKMRATFGDKPEGQDSELQRAIEIKRKNLELSLGVVRDYVLSVENLLLDLGGEEPKKITTAKELCEHCEDLALEIAGRLTNGADADEIKN